VTQDAEIGTGKTKNVFNVQITGYSITMEFVFQFQINATLTIDQETVLHAT
jgi:hypothetical protein